MPEAKVIVDTGPLVAFLVREDVHHAWAVEQFRRLPAPFLTCEAVLAEAFHLLGRVHGGAAGLFKLLQRGLVHVNFELMTERAALEKLVRKYSDLPMSLADACLVRLAELNRGASVFTTDHHFQIYRKNGRQIIPAILPPPR